MATPYDPALLVILSESPLSATLSAQIYRYADGAPKVRFVRPGKDGKDPRKIDSFAADDLDAVAAADLPALTAELRRHSAPPPPVPTVDPRVAALEAELAALRAKIAPPAPEAAPTPAPVAAPVVTPRPAPKAAPAPVTSPSTEAHPVAAARAALGL